MSKRHNLRRFLTSSAALSLGALTFLSSCRDSSSDEAHTEAQDQPALVESVPSQDGSDQEPTPEKVKFTPVPLA